MMKIPTEDETQKLFNAILTGEVNDMIEILSELLGAGLEEIEILQDILHLTAEKIKDKICRK